MQRKIAEAAQVSEDPRARPKLLLSSQRPAMVQGPSATVECISWIFGHFHGRGAGRRTTGLLGATRQRF
eukprot:1045715-Pleurochrysis_carterae.AAC.1